MAVTGTGVGCWKPQIVVPKRKMNAVFNYPESKQCFYNNSLKMKPQPQPQTIKNQFPICSASASASSFSLPTWLIDTFGIRFMNVVDFVVNSLVKTRQIVTLGILVPDVLDEDGKLEKEFQELQILVKGWWDSDPMVYNNVVLHEILPRLLALSDRWISSRLTVEPNYALTLEKFPYVHPEVSFTPYEGCNIRCTEFLLEVQVYAAKDEKCIQLDEKCIQSREDVRLFLQEIKAKKHIISLAVVCPNWMTKRVQSRDFTHVNL